MTEQFAFVVVQEANCSFSSRKKSDELTEDTYQKIKKKSLLKRAKLRAMHLLNDHGTELNPSSEIN
ncbi:MAG: hypothetical protein ACLR2O_04360 [Coprococcus sp.]